VYDIIAGMGAGMGKLLCGWDEMDGDGEKSTGRECGGEKFIRMW